MVCYVYSPIVFADKIAILAAYLSLIKNHY